VVFWSEDGVAKPVGTAESVDAAKEWCQKQADHFAPEGLPLHWRRYLSRGTGPSTAHQTATLTDRMGTMTFEIWTIGPLTA
jgi:hypothetical protein